MFEVYIAALLNFARGLLIKKYVILGLLKSKMFCLEVEILENLCTEALLMEAICFIPVIVSHKMYSRHFWLWKMKIFAYSISATSDKVVSLKTAFKNTLH